MDTPILSKHRPVVVLVVAVLAITGLFAFYSAPVASAQSGASVSIKNFSFNPSTITVVIGVNNTVTWTNNDGVTHTVTANDNSFGGSLSPGNTFTHTFTTAGNFSYHCSIHNYMKGTVIVLSPSSSSTSSTSSSTTSSTSSSTSSNSTSTVTTLSTTSSVTTSQSSSTQSTSVSSTTSSSSTQQSTASSPGQANGVPEFPFATIGILALTAVLAAAYVASRKTLRSRNGVTA